MTFEEAKNELESYRAAKSNEAMINLAIHNLRDVKAKVYSTDCVQQSNSEVIPFSKLKKLKMLDSRLRNAEIDVAIVSSEVVLKISKLKSPYCEILNLYYLQFFKDKAVMQILKRNQNFFYCERHYSRLKKKAIKEYAKIKDVSKCQ